MCIRDRLHAGLAILALQAADCQLLVRTFAGEDDRTAGDQRQGVMAGQVRREIGQEDADQVLKLEELAEKPGLLEGAAGQVGLERLQEAVLSRHP